MKNLTLIISTIILSLISHDLIAQIENISIVKSEVKKYKSKNNYLSYAANDGNDGFFSATMYYKGIIPMPSGYYIEHFNKDLELIESYDLELKNGLIKSLFIKDNQLHLIEIKMMYDGSSRTIEYNLLSSQLDKFNFKSKVIFTLPYEQYTYTNNNYGENNYDPSGTVELTDNNKFITFNYETREGNDKVHKIKVYDSSLTLLFDKTFRLNSNKRNLAYKSSIVTDPEDGTVYLLGKFIEQGSISEKKNKDVFTKLYKFNANVEQELTLNNDNLYVSSLKLVANNDKVICAGFYSEEGYNTVKGVAYYKIDKQSFQLQASTFNPFTEQLMTDKFGNVRGRQKLNKDKEIMQVNDSKVFLDKNGNAIITAEERFNTFSGPIGAASTRENYYFNDVIICKINAEGKIDWSRNVCKEQSAAGRSLEFLSYFSAMLNDNLIILLNGSDKVKELVDDRIQFYDDSVKNLSLYAVQVLPNGEFSYKKLINSDETKVSYKVVEAILLANNSIIVSGNKAKYMQFIKINQ
ncbi:hypothetical protein [Mesonia sp.]|uniref:hypothetical protein n=1 Tax=Mesonia sp. TaxID=1960830 RepID=UPI001777EAD9|nr:hypothetical protein [Mesonia sp.]HIB35974.1 hypothetical protein [Mesonia sp.]HIO27572.1 hypothetical protein [Flavobacteriaceae bacterium]